MSFTSPNSIYHCHHRTVTHGFGLDKLLRCYVKHTGSYVTHGVDEGPITHGVDEVNAMEGAEDVHTNKWVKAAQTTNLEALPLPVTEKLRSGCTFCAGRNDVRICTKCATKSALVSKFKLIKEEIKKIESKIDCVLNRRRKVEEVKCMGARNEEIEEISKNVCFKKRLRNAKKVALQHATNNLQELTKLFHLKEVRNNTLRTSVQNVKKALEKRKLPFTLDTFLSDPEKHAHSVGPFHIFQELAAKKRAMEMERFQKCFELMQLFPFKKIGEGADIYLRLRNVESLNLSKQPTFGRALDIEVVLQHLVQMLLGLSSYLDVPTPHPFYFGGNRFGETAAPPFVEEVEEGGFSTPYTPPLQPSSPVQRATRYFEKPRTSIFNTRKIGGGGVYVSESTVPYSTDSTKLIDGCRYTSPPPFLTIGEQPNYGGGMSPLLSTIHEGYSSILYSLPSRLASSISPSRWYSKDSSSNASSSPRRGDSPTGGSSSSSFKSPLSWGYNGIHSITKHLNEYIFDRSSIDVHNTTNQSLFDGVERGGECSKLKNIKNTKENENTAKYHLKCEDTSNYQNFDESRGVESEGDSGVSMNDGSALRGCYVLCHAIDTYIPFSVLNHGAFAYFHHALRMYNTNVITLCHRQGLDIPIDSNEPALSLLHSLIRSDHLGCMFPPKTQASISETNGDEWELVELLDEEKELASPHCSPSSSWKISSKPIEPLLAADWIRAFLPFGRETSGVATIYTEEETCDNNPTSEEMVWTEEGEEQDERLMYCV